MKRLELATLFCALAVTVVPAARGVLAGYTDLLRQAERFAFDGRRYVLAPAGETDQAGRAVRFPDLETAHATLPEVRPVDRVSALRPGDLVLMRAERGLVVAEFLATDGTFVKLSEPGAGTVAYRRRHFDTAFLGRVIVPEDSSGW